MPEKVLLVENDQAGSFEGDFESLCRRVAPNATCGKLEDVPREAWDLVVACGGDGTVRATVNALIQSDRDASLGIVPLGTANVIAKALGLPSEPEEALRVALGEDQKRLDVGVCDGEAFLLGCGLGLAERFVTAVGHEEKKRLGPLAYVKRLLAERHAPLVEFCVHGEAGELRLNGVGLVVANMAQLGSGIKPVGEVAADDGRLVLILLRHSGLWDFIRLGVKGLVGKAATDDALKAVPLKGDFRVSSEPKVPIQIDGDAVEQTSPFEFSVLPQRLLVRTQSDA